MNQARFIAEVYEITWQYNPDLDKNLSYEDCIEAVSYTHLTLPTNREV